MRPLDLARRQDFRHIVVPSPSLLRAHRGAVVTCASARVPRGGVVLMALCVPMSHVSADDLAWTGALWRAGRVRNPWIRKNHCTVDLPFAWSSP